MKTRTPRTTLTKSKTISTTNDLKKEESDYLPSWRDEPTPVRRQTTKKSFKQKISETKERRNKLMKMMEETLKAKFDENQEDEAYELGNQNKKKNQKYDLKKTGGDSLDDIDLI